MGVIVGRAGRGRVQSGAVLAIAATLMATVMVAIPGTGGVAGAAPGDRSPLVQIRATPAADLGLSDVAGVTFNAGEWWVGAGRRGSREGVESWIGLVVVCRRRRWPG